MKPTAFCGTVRHVQAETLVNTIQYSLPEVEAQTTVDTLRDITVRHQLARFLKRLEDVYADKVGKTLTYVMGICFVR